MSLWLLLKRITLGEAARCLQRDDIGKEKKQMFDSQPLDHVQVWVLFIVTTVLFLCALECGFRGGKFKFKRMGKEQNPQVNTILGASLGLLAFFLAFTFGMAGSRFDARKKLIGDEVNAVETTYLRAKLLPAPYNREFQDLLSQYVTIRADIQGVSIDTIPQVIAKSEKIHDLLWSKAVALTASTETTGITMLFINSLNEVFDLHGKRISAALLNRISFSIFFTLYFVAFLSMAMI
ncbi:MAG: hypothetical protein JRJ17_04990, partial [Deltaproteobacteria bacterium]|nr:hypothetical protein [Deltaproteobacteria bacterium]